MATNGKSKTARTVRVFTIGFTGKTAAQFFEKLQTAGVRRVIDIRLHNSSQLCGFTKSGDLKFFLKSVADIDYEHELELAPTAELFEAYKKNGLPWSQYETRFKALLDQRSPAESYAPSRFHRACLLCSEVDPEYCHRRLVAEYLKQNWPQIQIQHL
jgi:uncharacterized protein (DUF488 family)